MVKTARLRGIILEATPLSGSAARNRRARTVGTLRVEPGFRQIKFETDDLIKMGDVVDFDEGREGIARNVMKVAKRHY